MTNFIDEDLILLSNNNNSFYKQNVNNFILSTLLKTKIQHIAWHIFHSFSVIYPDEPTEEEQSRTKIFINKITNNLNIICSVCSKKNIIQFFCDYHKTVNTTLRQQKQIYEPNIYTSDFIINRYTKNDYISLIDTAYNINLFSLFRQNSMDDFFILFHKNVKETISYKELKNYNFDITFFTNYDITFSTNYDLKG